MTTPASTEAGGAGTEKRLIAESVAEVPASQRAVARVLLLHSKREFSGDGYGWTACAECRQCYPCATVKAVTEELLIDGSPRSNEGGGSVGS